MRPTLGCSIVLAVLVAFPGCQRGSLPPKSKGPHSSATIARSGAAKARVVVLTAGVAIKEGGPAETLRVFGEVYAFVPQVFVVRRDEPTEVTFWNLQPDDEHDFMLTDPSNRVLVKTKLPPLSKTKFVMTFHDEGLFPFYCVMHQPSMSGQILVVAPAGEMQP